MNPFTWLRDAARRAVLGGVQDALAEMTPTLETLAIRQALPALPDVEAEEEPVKAGKRKERA